MKYTFDSGDQTIDMKDFLKYFNSPLCPIQGFFASKITFESGKDFDDKFDIVEIKNNFTLVIKTD